MKIAIIAAHAENLVIGKNNKIPWHYSEDLKRFKRLTMGFPIIMGRKTFESIGSRPLPGRENIIISTTKTYDHVKSFQSLDNALKNIKSDKVFIIGGARLYREILTHADLLYITLIHKVVEGDVYFPEYRNDINSIWKETYREDYPMFSFINYERQEK